MDCELIQKELVAYHFGTVDAAVRERVEAHLLSCPSCLRGFLALKREIETADAGPRPSSAARARLRAAVAQEIAKPVSGPAPSPVWWRQPLAFGFAAAACAATLLALVSVRGQLQLIARLSEAPPAIDAPAQPAPPSPTE